MVHKYKQSLLVFVAVVVISTALFLNALIVGDRELVKVDGLVDRTYQVITLAEELSKQVEGILASQRGYILSKDEKFRQEYEDKKAAISENIAVLSELMNDNKSQESRLDEIRFQFNEFSSKLEERMTISDPSNLADGVELVNRLRNNILRVNEAVLTEQYDILNAQIQTLNQRKDSYFRTLLYVATGGAFMLILLNVFIFYIQGKRSFFETSLKDTEERFALAIDGTQDGIYDYDFINETVFYSRRYYEMLGYDREGHMGDPDESREFMHPEDRERVVKALEDCKENKTSDYSEVFRMKDANGNWRWIHSRAKLLFDKETGEPVRMVGAHSDITEMKENEARLLAEKRRAEEANKAKGDFLAHMSHELRTPLTAISGIAEIFMNKAGEMDKTQARLTKTLHSSTDALKDLVNDILDFSKIESRELELDKEEFEPAMLFEEVISMMAVRAGEKNIDFVCDYDGVKNLQIEGDRKRLRQILVNLVGNAIKFTEKGSVTIDAYIKPYRRKKHLWFEVKDTGIGIGEEYFDAIFERFKQADSSVSRRFGGTGLGLPISKNLALLMKGDIVLKSKPGKGSTFTLRIPLDVIKEKEESKSATAAFDKSATLPKQQNILLVEDYEGNIVMLSYLLEEMGYSFDVARTGSEALDLWGKNKYDAVLMDIQMPEMDGFTATRKIREMEKQKKKKHTPIIGMTAHALVGDKDKCIEAGMDAYLPKPIAEENLTREMKRFLAA